MAISFDQISRIITEQAEEVVQIFTRALWVDSFSVNREFVFSFSPLGEKPPFEIHGECRFRWDLHQFMLSLEGGAPLDEEGNPLDESFLDIEVSILLPPFSSLPDMSAVRNLLKTVVPQYNAPLFNLSQDYNIEDPSATVYHLKLDYLWSFEGEARILTTRFADIFHDMGQVIRELNRARGGWETAHYT
jgi:hypothetical protein